MNVKLRYLEHSDIDNLLLIENDKRYWHLSGLTEPFTKEELFTYIKNASEDINTAGQLRFVIEVNNEFTGLIDLYEYDKESSIAGVGIFVLELFRAKGIAKKALKILMEYSKFKLKISTLFARIEEDNLVSTHLFEHSGFVKIKTLENYIIKNFTSVDCGEYTIDLD